MRISKNIIFPMILCSISHTTLAHPSHLTQPWEISLKTLYLQPNSIGPTTESITYGAPHNSPYEDYDDLQPGWNWGFRASTAYHFDSNKDINLSWTHFSGDSSDKRVDNDTLIYGLYTSNFLTNSNEINSIQTDVTNKLDTINLELGVFKYPDKKISTRLHAGLQYARIQQTINQTAWDYETPAVYDNSNVDSTFNGVGPRFGLDSSFYFIQTVSVFGNIAGSLLAGQLDYHQTEIYTNADGSTAFQPTRASDTEQSITPTAEAQMGLRYTASTKTGDITLEAGYEIANYWNSVTTSSEYKDAEKTDFGYDGVFLGIKFRPS